MGNTHFSGPILVDGGPFANAPISSINQRSNYKVTTEQFTEDVPDIAGMETVGWAETAVGSPGSPSVLATPETGYLLLNPGTTADTGTNLQRNLAPTAARVPSSHNILGPMTSTTTLMDNRELFFETRVGFMSDTTAWDGHFMCGWLVTDTLLMTATTGVAAIATGGGIGFHVGETGVVSFFTQATVVGGYTAVDTGLNILALDTAATFQWYTLGFRARWVDASAGTGVVDFFRDGSLIGTVSNGLPMQSTEVYSVSYECSNGPARDVDVAVDYVTVGVSRPGFTIP